MGKPRILIVDDERRMCRTLEILLQREGPFETISAHDYYQAAETLKTHVDLVLTDLTMPGRDGIEMLRFVKAERPAVPVILMTAYSTVASAVTAMKEGAYDYIVKPFENDDLLALIRKALRKEGHPDSEDVPSEFSRFGPLVGRSAPMQEAYAAIRRIAGTDSTALITGESGTGKELVARAVHDSGARKKKPFLALNCSAVPHDLMESELFGHERGAFTGAVRRKHGKFESAEGGTIFLDEIGDMPLALQAKLLRVLQERAFERVGSSETISVDVRIVAATNHDLEAASRQGRFRDDLFYRLNVVTIRLPPLRERAGDIPLLAEHFLKKKCERIGVPEKKLSEEAYDKLAGHGFPGNVRELENAIERAVVMSSNEVLDSSDILLGREIPSLRPEDLSVPVQGGLGLLDNLHSRLERSVIERALRMYPDKSNTELAVLLGTSRRVLEARMHRYDIRKPAAGNQGTGGS